MPRRPWILWLMLALLPLRGFAAGWMPAQQSAQVVMQLGAAAPDVAPPCHDTDSGPSACCTLCDLCHGAAAAATSAGPMLATLPRLAVRQAAARDTGRQPLNLLERPPRTLGA